jgi:hypothetical protein
VSIEAVVALVIGTIVVLVAPALILSTDIIEQTKKIRPKTERH